MKKSNNFFFICFFPIFGTLSLYAQDRGPVLQIREVVGQNATIGKQWAVFIAINQTCPYSPCMRYKRPSSKIRGQSSPRTASWKACGYSLCPR